eukprot:scaffold4795_cov126-Isochrysis_galbana.AAC.5
MQTYRAWPQRAPPAPCAAVFFFFLVRAPANRSPIASGSASAGGASVQGPWGAPAGGRSRALGCGSGRDDWCRPRPGRHQTRPWAPRPPCT